MPVLVGTSGWQYRHWKGRFYPHGLPQRAWLEHYAHRFATVESNSTFYRLPAPDTFARWAAGTPDDFVWAVKASRFLTHVRRLREPEEPVRRLLERAGHLGAKLGPVLLQLPPALTADLRTLERALACFPAGLRVAVEPRHPSWFTPATRALLRERGAALCLADSPARQAPAWRTASWGYLRFHAGTASPWPCYERAALARWARRVAELWPPDADVYAYFNNDPEACAVRDASWFAEACAAVGLQPTRTPSPLEVRVQG